MSTTQYSIPAGSGQLLENFGWAMIWLSLLGGAIAINQFAYLPEVKAGLSAFARPSEVRTKLDFLVAALFAASTVISVGFSYAVVCLGRLVRSTEAKRS